MVRKDAEEDDQQAHSWLGYCLLYGKRLLVFAIAFLVVAFVLNKLIPSPPVPENVIFIGPKYHYYQQHKERYNTLFFGSSRIFNHIIPAVFDQTVAAAGEQTQSFNFGIPAMRVLNSYFLLEQVLADPPKNLKWVFIETVLDRGYEPIENARTSRAIYWHNLDNTLFSINYVLTSPESLSKRVIFVGSHLLPFFYNQINVGRIFNQLIPQTGLNAEEEHNKNIFLANQGYFPLSSDPANPGYRHFLQQQDAYLQRLKQRQEQNEKSDFAVPLPINKKKLLSLIVEQVKVAGAIPIFIVSPTLNQQDELHRAHAQQVIPTLIAFDNPMAYPELYELALRYDELHLNEKGAQLFSRLLAEQFVTEIAQSAQTD